MDTSARNPKTQLILQFFRNKVLKIVNMYLFLVTFWIVQRFWWCRGCVRFSNRRVQIQPLWVWIIQCNECKFSITNSPSRVTTLIIIEDLKHLPLTQTILSWFSNFFPGWILQNFSKSMGWIALDAPVLTPPLRGRGKWSKENIGSPLRS